MSVRTSSPIFDLLRAPGAEGGFSEEDVAAIVSYAERSPILMRRLSEFEAAKGRIVFNTSSVNCYWREAENETRGLPSIYLATEYRSTGEFAGRLDVVTQLITHELAHFETDFGTAGGFNTNNMPNKDIAAVVGVRDEARAYALEYIVQSEINRTEPTVSCLVDEQRDLAKAAVDALPVEQRDELRMLNAATIALLDWAANWTGPNVEAGGYFEFYQNEYLKRQNIRVACRNVKFACDPDGRIMSVTYDTVSEGVKLVNVEPRIGAFTPATLVA